LPEGHHGDTPAQGQTCVEGFFDAKKAWFVLTRHSIPIAMGISSHARCWLEGTSKALARGAASVLDTLLSKSQIEEEAWDCHHEKSIFLKTERMPGQVFVFA
jgi:hypothetical protein